MNLVLVCVALLATLGLCIVWLARLEHVKHELERDLDSARDLVDSLLRDEDWPWPVREEESELLRVEPDGTFHFRGTGA